MIMTIRKWGNSLAVRIPKTFASDVGLEDGSDVNLTLVDGGLIITPVVESQLTLDELLAGVTEDNLHQEQDFGQPEGREAW